SRSRLSLRAAYLSHMPWPSFLGADRPTDPVAAVRLWAEYENRIQPDAMDRPVMSSALGWLVLSSSGPGAFAMSAVLRSSFVTLAKLVSLSSLERTLGVRSDPRQANGRSVNP